MIHPKCCQLSCLAKLVEIDSWQEEKAIRDRIRALGFFVVQNKIVVVITDVVIVDAQASKDSSGWD